MKIRLALQWLETCIKCPAWSWDPEQKQAAQAALDAAVLEEQCAPPKAAESIEMQELRNAWNAVVSVLNRVSGGWHDSRRPGDKDAQAGRVIERLAEEARDNAKLSEFFRSDAGAAMGAHGDGYNMTPAECAIWHLKNSIPLTPAEIQSKLSRVRWAEGLISQLPADHEGRNSWLLNYGQPGALKLPTRTGLGGGK